VANDTNDTFRIISNSPANGSGASWDQVAGLVNRGSANNSTAGAVSDTTIDIPFLGSSPVIVTVEVASASGPLGANGIFVGLQAADGGANAGGELWNNLGPSFEDGHGLDRDSPKDAAWDPDGDGADNRDEYTAATDPTNAASFFRGRAIDATDGASITFDANTGRFYTLQFTDDLAGSSWRNVPGQGPRRGSGPGDAMTDTNTVPRRYYRLGVSVP